MKQVKEFGQFLRSRGIYMLAGAVLLSALGQIIVTLNQQAHEDEGRREQIEQITVLLQDVKEELKTQAKDNAEANRKRDERIDCLLQLHSTSGDFTGRAECQRLVMESSQAAQSSGENRPNTQPGPAPEARSQETPKPPEPEEECTVKLLGLCV